MYITAVKVEKDEWKIYYKDTNVIQTKDSIHYVIGDEFPLSRVDTVEMENLKSSAAGSFYGYVAFSVNPNGHLLITTDITGALPLYYVKGKVVTTNFLTAKKFGRPKVMEPRSVINTKSDEKMKYYTLRTNYLFFSEGDIEKELTSYLYRELGGKSAAISFSGGLDSTILAKLASKFARVHLFTLGLEGSYDMEMAQKTAKELGLDWTPIFISEDHVFEVLPQILDAIPFKTQMDISLATGFFLLGKEVKQRGYKIIVVGQLADELFGGYKKYRDVPLESLNETLLKDVEKSYFGLARDVASFEFSGIKVILPYTRKRIVNTGLKTSPTLKISGTINKYILRKLAKKLDLPEFVIYGRKKAFQYGSGIDKLVKKWMKHHEMSFELYSL